MNYLVPLARSLHFLDLSADDIPLQGTKVIDKQDAVKMIDFVFESAGEQFLALDLDGLSFFVLRSDCDLVGARYGLAKAGKTEATFFAGLPAIAGKNFGIDDDDLLGFVFADTDVDDRDAFCWRRSAARARPTPLAAYMVSHISSMSRCKSGVSNSVTGSEAFSKAGSPYFKIVLHHRITYKILEVFYLGHVALEVAARFTERIAAKFFEEGRGKRNRHHGFADKRRPQAPRRHRCVRKRREPIPAWADRQIRVAGATWR